MTIQRTTRLLAVAGLLALLTACGINPVTGKKEIQFVSEAQELQIGEQHYGPTRQGEGGDLTVLPELTTYVSGVGQKLAAVADRKLPYEFVVLNNSVPNAWALPGGKIAVNRGLLTELQNESELAAVLGHEIVHAAARHGALAMQRGLLLQGALIATQVAAQRSDYGGLTVGAASLGAQLLTMRNGREAELESDLYGMRYMSAAGYDPSAAITLQETFVRLSAESGGSGGRLARLFATHPPSEERVAANRATAATLTSLTRPARSLLPVRFALQKPIDLLQGIKLARLAPSVALPSANLVDEAWRAALAGAAHLWFVRRRNLSQRLERRSSNVVLEPEPRPILPLPPLPGRPIRPEKTPPTRDPAARAVARIPAVRGPPPMITAPMAGKRTRGMAKTMAKMSTRKVIPRVGRVFR